jgi:hypothetical protein
MTFGPMQVLVVGFDGTEFTGKIAAELRRLREHDIVRLADLIVVRKGADGDVETLETSDLSDAESEQLGSLAGALIGLGAAGEQAPETDGALPGDVWFVADAIPAGTTAAVAVLEHRWAIPLRDAIQDSGGQLFADAWLHPADLAELSQAAHSSGPV